MMPPVIDMMGKRFGRNIAVISFRANRIKSDATCDEMRKVLAYMEVGTCDS